ncbi:MAG: hypothetical protein IPM54_27375 [Polyangiaceae bacterium]|nr:hypothetical protein [Polyangiaceae bacterium]
MTLVPLGVLGASCALGGFEQVGPPPVDAGTDLGCQHATVPLPPNIADADFGDGDPNAETEFTVALKAIRMKRSADAGPLGLDLDRFCSCQGETPSCIPPPGQKEELACDKPEGRDNQAAALFGLIETVLLFDPEQDELSELYSSFANLGRWSILMRISNYNGLANDPQVRVEWYPSGGTPMPPQWNGSDEWPIVPSAISDAGSAMDGGLLARYFDNEAYVVDGKLVFALLESEFTATNGLTQLSMTISDGTGMARIESVGVGQYALRDGVIAGRVKLIDLFKMVTDFRDHNGAPLCATVSNPFWGVTRDAFCRGLDIQVGSPQLNKKCDAFSVGLGFESEPARIGAIEPGMSGQMNCNPGEDPLSVYLDAGCPPPMNVDAAVPVDAPMD